MAEERAPSASGVADEASSFTGSIAASPGAPVAPVVSAKNVSDPLGNSSFSSSGSAAASRSPATSSRGTRRAKPKDKDDRSKSPFANMSRPPMRRVGTVQGQERKKQPTELQAAIRRSATTNSTTRTTSSTSIEGSTIRRAATIGAGTLNNRSSRASRTGKSVPLSDMSELSALTTDMSDRSNSTSFRPAQDSTPDDGAGPARPPPLPSPTQSRRALSDPTDISHNRVSSSSPFVSGLHSSVARILHDDVDEQDVAEASLVGQEHPNPRSPLYNNKHNHKLGEAFDSGDSEDEITATMDLSTGFREFTTPANETRRPLHTTAPRLGRNQKMETQSSMRRLSSFFTGLLIRSKEGDPRDPSRTHIVDKLGKYKDTPDQSVNIMDLEGNGRLNNSFRIDSDDIAKHDGPDNTRVPAKVPNSGTKRGGKRPAKKSGMMELVRGLSQRTGFGRALSNRVMESQQDGDRERRPSFIEIMLGPDPTKPKTTLEAKKEGDSSSNEGWRSKGLEACTERLTLYGLPCLVCVLLLALIILITPQLQEMTSVSARPASETRPVLKWALEKGDS